MRFKTLLITTQIIPQVSSTQRLKILTFLFTKKSTFHWAFQIEVSNCIVMYHYATKITLDFYADVLSYESLGSHL